MVDSIHNILDLCCAGKHSKAGKHEKTAKPATESAISKAASTAADAITKAISRNLKKSQVVEDEESEEDDDSEDDSDEVRSPAFIFRSLLRLMILNCSCFKSHLCQVSSPPMGSMGLLHKDAWNE